VGDELGDFPVDIWVLGGQTQFPNEVHLHHFARQHFAFVLYVLLIVALLQVACLLVHQTKHLFQDGEPLVVIVTPLAHVHFEELHYLLLVSVATVVH
jgi:hypothetical protein